MTTTTTRERPPRVRTSRAKATEKKEAEKVQRAARRDWVRLGDVRVNPVAQREFVQSKADQIAANFDPESFGVPVVNLRAGRSWMIDGQHRAAAMRIWCGPGWEDQHFEADVYEGLTEPQEAEAFLRRNDAMAVNVYNKFRIAVVAGREDEQAVAGIVFKEGLYITRDQSKEGRIVAVGTLLRIYRTMGDKVLGRTLAIIRDVYGTPGLTAATLNGLAVIIHRYDNIDDAEMIRRLSKASGGVTALLDKAERKKRETGNPKYSCVAAAIVDTFNSMSAEKQGGNGTKLRSWWKVSAE